MRTTGNQTFSSGYLFFPQAISTGSTADLMAVAFDPTNGKVDGEAKLVARGIDYVSGADEATFAVSGSTLLYAASTNGVTGPSLAWLDRAGKKLWTISLSSNASDM